MIDIARDGCVGGVERVKGARWSLSQRCRRAERECAAPGLVLGHSPPDEMALRITIQESMAL